MLNRITAISMLLLMIFYNNAIAGCDMSQANKVKNMIREMATWNDSGGITEVKWGKDWDQFTPREKLSMITVFADADACLTGHANKIEFYRNGKLVGEASPTTGVSLK